MTHILTLYISRGSFDTSRKSGSALARTSHHADFLEFFSTDVAPGIVEYSSGL